MHGFRCLIYAHGLQITPQKHRHAQTLSARGPLKISEPKILVVMTTVKGVTTDMWGEFGHYHVFLVIL